MGDAADELADAAALLEDPARVLELAGHAITQACPRGLGFVLTLPSPGSEEIAVLRGFREGGNVSIPMPQAYPAGGYDRQRVAADQRDTWVEPLGSLVSPEEYRQTGIYRMLQPLGVMEFGRHLVCVGGRVVACVGLLLPEHEHSFTDEERTGLRLAAQAAGAGLRVSSVLVTAPPTVDALDHVMAARADRAMIVESGGRILECSPAAKRLLDETAGLIGAVAKAVRSRRLRAGTVTLARLGLDLHVSPCSARGGATSYLVILGESGGDGRGRVSARQAELLDHLAAGLTNREIAERMGVTPSTIKTMLERLYRRADVQGRVALLRWAGR